MSKIIPTFIINLKYRDDRKTHISQEFFKKTEFKLHFFDAIKHPNGAVGFFKSFQQVIHIAKEKKYNYVLICEDDHKFTKSYDSSKFLQQISLGETYGFDVLLGGVSNFHEAIVVNEDLCWIGGFTGLQFSVIFKCFYDRILEYDLKPGKDWDISLGNLSDQVFCVNPMISEQKYFGYSDITSMNDNYNVENYFVKSRQKIEYLYRITKYYEQFR